MIIRSLHNVHYNIVEITLNIDLCCDLLLFWVVIGSCLSPITYDSFGSWGSIRMLCRADAPVFMIAYISGKYLTMLFISMTFGMMYTMDNHYFDEATFFSAFSMENFPPFSHLLAILVAGFCTSNGDFLISCACTRVST